MRGAQRLINRFPQQRFGFTRAGRSAKQPVFRAGVVKFALPRKGIVILSQSEGLAVPSGCAVLFGHGLTSEVRQRLTCFALKNEHLHDRVAALPSLRATLTEPGKRECLPYRATRNFLPM